MFVSEELKTHFETSATIRSQSLITAEWNMNVPENIFKIGNYRYRPTDPTSQFFVPPLFFDQLDAGNFYTGATDADVVIDGGINNNGSPQLFTSIKEKMKILYSLEDCTKPFRPRSGINKPLYFGGKYIANSGANLAQRPRYYMPSRYDEFKYWTSYRTESGQEYGISNIISNGIFYINDVAPFVVYKENVPANRIVIKMQTNVGDVNLGPFVTEDGTFEDPLYGDINKTTPVRWKIQYLVDNSWTDAVSFNEGSTRNDGSPIIGSDGYVEIQYGLIVPEQYRNIFVFAETLASTTLLPEKSVNGYAYLVIPNENDLGTFYIWDSLADEYKTFTPEYGWALADEVVSTLTNFVTTLVSPPSFNSPTLGPNQYREFAYLRGIRVVVETMNKFDSTFDLIEMSPRLVTDLTDSVLNYTVQKALGDLGNFALPVGQLLASTGKISIFDVDQAFNENNTLSIVSKYVDKKIKFNFYEVILDVNGFDYYVPIKTLYSEGLPQSNDDAGTIEIELRDMFFYLESMPAPRMLTTQTSLSYAISMVLDYIGFSNYVFKRLDNEADPIIPYFFVGPDQNVAELLNKLAVSTQTAMFFDEYNNLVVMSKNYMLPNEGDREVNMVLSGNNNQVDDGVVENRSTGLLPNILAISSKDKTIYNDGKISYTTRYIQRSYGSLRQASLVDAEKTWIYKPVLLWEVSGTEATKTVNEVAAKQGSYILGAMPINSDLNDSPPFVANHQIVNNVIDVGENVYWLTRYQGYLYSNGEIIKYDAAQFNITGVGNVWITSNQEYQNYFSKLPFNGKIYPTGLLRIYATPFYETVEGISRMQNGPVYEHGRNQFGTQITSHSAGISQYWSNNDNIRGCNMQSQYLFSTSNPIMPATESGQAGVNNDLAKQTTRNSIIKNFMATNYLTETQVNNLKSTQSGTIQSSALVMNGPSFSIDQKPINFVSYVYKQLNNSYKHFGTRMRIIGKVQSGETRVQTPNGSMTYYEIAGARPDQSSTIGGGSGGIAVMIDPSTNNGYYFEIIALTEQNIESYMDASGSAEPGTIANVVFYKVKKQVGSDNAIPEKLWSGLTKIVVDDGRFTGQYRFAGEDTPTVYDLSVEYQDIGPIRRFYLYINNKLVKVVDDASPLPVYNNMALFIRGSSRCMFENIYALSENYSQNTVFTVNETIAEAFGDKQIDAQESFRKYAMSGMVQATYLSGISAQQPPKYNMYFEEFGTIMRECAYFDIKYDRAYPALYAQLSPTLNRLKGYTTSGFYADSYGAEFLIFNATDTALNLDDTTGNYLRIQGITFTQDTSHELSVDEYFKKRGILSSTPLQGSPTVFPSIIEKETYDQIRLSRINYGKREFSIDTPYIQTDDDAQELMGWIISKIMMPKKAIGIKMFATPTLQLGDLVTINYKDNNNLDLVTPENKKFIVYNIEYSRTQDGPEMNVYLSEV